MTAVQESDYMEPEVTGEVDSAECADCSLIELKSEMSREQRTYDIGGTAQVWSFWLCQSCLDAREREWWDG